jgi:hypothetical protein
MENVSVRAEGALVDLPAAPHFRLEKEIKNVVTVIAKTCHYWLGHMPLTQRRRIAHLFALIGEDAPLVTPATASDGDAGGEAAAAALADAIARAVGLPRSPHRYVGWVGVETSGVKAAIWMMRALVVHNVLARREETTLFLPVDAGLDPGGALVAAALHRVHALATARGILQPPG